MENSSKNTVDKKRQLPKIKWRWVILLPIWTYAAFWLAQIVVLVLQGAIMSLGVPLQGVNQTLLITTISALVYILAVVIVIGVPLWLWRRRTTATEMGASDWPAWMDLLISVPAYVVYMIASAITIAIVSTSLSGFELSSDQQLPFSQTMLGANWHYVMAFLTLVVFAPLAEELLFRGYLYGKLRKSAPIWLAVLVSGLAFGLAHLWGGPGSELQWLVMIDTMVLGVMLALLREYTGAVWAGVLVHALKNGIAFYLLFVNPQLIEQLQAAILPAL